MAQTEKLIGPLNRAVVAQIAQERLRQGRSRREVWEAAGMTRSTYIRVETAQRALDVEQLGLIAAALGVSASSLVRRAESAAQPRRESTEVAEIDPASLGLAADTTWPSWRETKDELERERIARAMDS